MSYRVIDPFAVYLDQAGRVLDGGSFQFLDADTSAPKAVFANPALTVSNGSTVAIDASGRAAVDAWGSGNYRVRMFDALGALVREVNPVTDPAGSGALAIPALVADAFLTNDASQLLWQSIRQLPDPTGQSGKILGTDGANAIWQPPPATPAAVAPDIVVGANSFRAGVSSNTSKFLIQRGTASAPASGTPSTSVAVTFPEPFDTLWHVQFVPTTNSQPSGAPAIPFLTASPTTSGFSAGFDIAEGDKTSGNIVNPIPFSWIAFGLKTVAPPTP